MESPPSPAHRYRASRPWPVALLAAGAAGVAVLLTGGLSTAFTLATASARAPAEQRAGDSIARTAPPVSPPASVTRPPVAPPPGAWHIQIGAFRSPGAAQAHLRATAASVPEIASLPEAYQVRGKVTRVRLGGIASEEAARSLCGRIVDAGGSCFAVAP